MRHPPTHTHTHCGKNKIGLHTSTYNVHPTLLSIAVIKAFTKVTWGGGGLFDFHIPSHGTLKKVRTGIWRQKLRQKPCRNATYSLFSINGATYSLFSINGATYSSFSINGSTGILISPRTTCLGWPYHGELGSPTSIIKKVHPQIYLCLWWRHFLIWNSLFTDDLSLHVSSW